MLGYDFRSGSFTHGPLIGAILQRVYVSAFTESGGYASLSFDSQVRDSEVSSVGYRVSVEAGAWKPFAQLLWNHEFASTDRWVTAYVTTLIAPGYSMPAVIIGTDWGTATVGTTFRLRDNPLGDMTVTSQFAQHGVSTYGGQFGITLSF